MVFQDLVQQCKPVILKEVKRTKTSAILRNAKRILKGDCLVETDDSFQWITEPLFTYSYPGVLRKDLISQKRLDSIFQAWNVECLCITARNQDVAILASYLHHKHLKNLDSVSDLDGLWTHRCTNACLQVGSRVAIMTKIREGKYSEKILAVKGDTGIIVERNETHYKVKVRDKELLCFDSMVKLGYSGTIHSCQGGEATKVYMFLPDPTCPLLDARFLYVGMTRARAQVCLVGSEKSYQVGVQKGFPYIHSTVKLS